MHTCMRVFATQLAQANDECWSPGHTPLCGFACLLRKGSSSMFSRRNNAMLVVACLLDGASHTGGSARKPHRDRGLARVAVQGNGASMPKQTTVLCLLAMTLTGITPLSSSRFASKVTTSSQPLLFSFGTDWCGLPRVQADVSTGHMQLGFPPVH